MMSCFTLNRFAMGRLFVALNWAIGTALLGAGLLGASAAHAQPTPISEITDSDGNALMVVYDNGELEVTGGFLLPDGTLIDASSDLGGGFSLPFSGTTSSSSDLLDLTQTGSGRAGRFAVENTDSFIEALIASTNGSGNAIKGVNSGTGRAGLFQILNESNDADALAATTNGTGRAGNFSVTHTDNGSSALFAETVGIGRAGLFRIANAGSGAEAFRAETNGMSHAGVFDVDNASNDSSAVQGQTNGTGPAVQGIQRGTGHAGHFQVFNPNSAVAALRAETFGTGPAVEGIQSGGAPDSSAHAGFFEIFNSESDAEALLVQTNGSGEAVDAIQTGTGPGARAGLFRITSSDNDKAALRASTFGSGFAAALTASKSATVRDNPGGNVVLMKNGSDQIGPDVLGLVAGPSDPDLAVNYVSFYDGSGTSVGAIEGNGDGGVRYKTSGADFAEALPVADGAERPEPADLVGVRGGQASLNTAGADRLMIVSGQAAVLGNAYDRESEATRERVPVAFIGQVPVKVRGAAEPGDWIVASGRADGTTRAVAPADYRRAEHGPIVGQAWSAKATEGVGTAVVAVGLDHSDALAKRLQEQQAQIDSLRNQLHHVEALQKRVARLEASSTRDFRLAGVPGAGLLVGLLVGGVAGAALLGRRST